VTAAAGITTSAQPPTAVVNIQPGMNVQPVVLVDQNGQYVTPGGGTATTAASLATTTNPVNVAAATAPTTGQVLTATSATTATWQAIGTAATANALATATSPVNVSAATAPSTNQALIATSATTATWQFVPIAAGGTGGTTATSAYNNLSPMTTLGDIEYESGANTAARLAGNTATQQKFLSQTGNGTVSAAPAWSVVSGQYLCAPTNYAPGAQVTLNASSGTFAAFSSATVNTGSFAAPPSGTVIVEVALAASISASNNYAAFGLAAHGTTSPMIGNAVIFKDDTPSYTRPYSLTFPVTGLSAGTSYNFDLMGACASSNTLAVVAIGQSSTAPTLSAGNQGAPVVMAVRAV